MASKYCQTWLPAAFSLYIDIVFLRRYCVCYCKLIIKSAFSSEIFECMAILWTSFRTIMPKYYWSLVVAFSMSMFVVLYYCFNENALTDDASNNKVSVFGNLEFVEGQKHDTDSVAKYLHGNKITTSKCNDLYETALDMLYNGEKVPLPFESDATRWNFHKRGNLDYLKPIYRRWSKLANFSKSLHSRDYLETKSKDIKAKKYFVTFACNCCKKSKVTATKSARDPGGFDFATVHGTDSLSKEFRHAHSAILRQERGCGYWLWKPYIILKTFIESMLDNDLLMYQDAGAHLIGDAGPLLRLSQELDPGILVFHTRFLEEIYTKRDAFVLMDMDDERVYKSYQRLASFVILRKNCKSLQFVMEWLAYASDPRILTNIDNQMGKPNFPIFKENRHDQTVLSLLSKRWQLDEFRDPSQYGNIDQQSLMYALGPYKQLIFHSRDTS